MYGLSSSEIARQRASRAACYDLWHTPRTRASSPTEMRELVPGQAFDKRSTSQWFQRPRARVGGEGDGARELAYLLTVDRMYHRYSREADDDRCDPDGHEMSDSCLSAENGRRGRNMAAMGMAFFVRDVADDGLGTVLALLDPIAGDDC